MSFLVPKCHLISNCYITSVQKDQVVFNFVCIFRCVSELQITLFFFPGGPTIRAFTAKIVLVAKLRTSDLKSLKYTKFAIYFVPASISKMAPQGPRAP